MVAKTSDSSSSKSRKSNGDEAGDGIEGLSCRLNQLKRQIQGERVLSIKERFESNRKKTEIHVSRIRAAASSRINLSVEDNANGNTLLSRMRCPLVIFNGFPHGVGDRDYALCKDVVTTTIKLPNVEKLPRYTTWMFLDRNQRMAEDQSVVGRRQIYYDQQEGETLICSDSEEDVSEPEEEKHEFTEGEDHIIWTIGQEYGLGDDVLNTVSHFIRVETSYIQDRFNELKVKNEVNVRDSVDSGPKLEISLAKSLSAALDSFDNLFCRRCLVFDCRLHGCSQTLIEASEKQPYWSEHEGDRKPCSEQCYLRLRAVKDVPETSNLAVAGMKNVNSGDEDKTMTSSNMEELHAAPGDVDLQTEKKKSLKSESVKTLEADFAAQDSDPSATGKHDCGSLGKRKASVIDDSKHDSNDIPDSSNKKQNTSVALGKKTSSDNSTPNMDQISSDISNMDQISSDRKDNQQGGTLIESEGRMSSRSTQKDPPEHAPRSFVCGGGSSHNHSGNSSRGGTEGIAAIPQQKQSSAEWKPMEKELYLKGVEIFGRNSCLIARNLLSGLKSCIEVSSYMREHGASIPHRSNTSTLLLEEKRNDVDGVEQEKPKRTRLFRRRGKTRKLKYSTKSAGHPSVWKRISGGKNQSCKQYTPCGCQSMCGKQCPCLTDGTCCEKYCGCSKSCKNRFRGCHCAKSQCRSRQCPCFAAGRECDPDVCRNCWVSCGDGTLSEPPRRGEGQCGNMRLLLRQQQRILLAKSDVAGWGAFLKNSVNKNEYLGEYTGELISHREADKRGKIYDRANSSFLFDLNDQYVLDAHRKGDKLKFANHSSKPNCYAKVMFVAGDHRVGIFANERIEASEELFYDYRYGPDHAPAWARKPEGSKKDDSSNTHRRARKHQSH